jgi:hypothetical protein
MPDDFDQKLERIAEEYRRHRARLKALSEKAGADRTAVFDEFRKQIDTTLRPMLQKAHTTLATLLECDDCKIIHRDEHDRENPRITLEVPSRSSSITITPSEIQVTLNGQKLDEYSPDGIIAHAQRLPQQERAKATILAFVQRVLRVPKDARHMSDAELRALFASDDL